MPPRTPGTRATSRARTLAPVATIAGTFLSSQRLASSTRPQTDLELAHAAQLQHDLRLNSPIRSAVPDSREAAGWRERCGHGCTSIHPHGVVRIGCKAPLELDNARRSKD